MKNLFVPFFFLLCITASAQKITHSFVFDDVSLADALDEVGNAFDVKFSYKTIVVKNKRVSLSISDGNLENVIRDLGNHTGITFNRINGRYYVLKESPLAFCGYLNDKTDEFPIVGATVANVKKRMGTVTNNDGFFKLENIYASDTISISYLGYKTLVFSVGSFNENDCSVFQLSSDTQMLQEVVVKEYLARGISKNQDGAIRISPNNQDILSGLPEPDVLQSTQLLPGIESPNETASGLYIRGGTPDQNLILWDGIKMYNSDHFFGMLSAFNPYIVKDVKVYRSGALPEYGDRVSGVLDIETDNRIADRAEGGFGFNMTHGDAYLKIPISEKFGFQISARRSFTDFFDTPTFNKFTDKVFQNTSIRRNQEVFEPEFTKSTQTFYFTDVTLKTIWDISEKNSITVSALSTRNKLDYSFEDTEFVDISSDKLNIKNYGISATWNSDWNTKISSKFQTYHSTYDFTYDGRNQYFNSERVTSKRNTIKETGLSFKVNWQINEKWSFGNGYQFFNNRVDFLLQQDDFSESDKVDNPTHSLFQNLVYQFKTGYAQIGLRSSYYSELERFLFEPRLYVEKKLGKNIRLKGSAEVRGQAISQVLEFATLDFGLENQIWALANGRDIPMLESYQFSAGLLWYKNGWSAEIEAYHKTIDGITSFTRGFESVDNSFTKGKSVTNGADLFVKKKWNNYSSWLGYTLSNTDFGFSELNMGNSFKGNNNIGHSLTWSHFYTWKNLQFSLGWKYRTGIPFTEAVRAIETDDNVQIEYGTINDQNLPDYHRLDFSLIYDFVLSKKQNPVKAKIGFSLQNIYGQRNILNRSYGLFQVADEQNNISVELQEIARYSLGTTPNLVFRLQF
ncbi:carboxypeptidase-like regulatory domain-containing protein [Flagellimonas pacifica]|uniref:Outer membrane receptor for ferrienterochelin and colicins n=1 Tax=Flagellimonas pacifica TaxID=1247520 RepID=A0A285MEA0_9FLAO|nr:carboxypeptidase-like regulatory domain-containing protein [Allomuricauda parva]SNY95438.1 Outer membrane receptor for ferrienterochelin and colicins [Allomuricauda parva]